MSSASAFRTLYQRLGKLARTVGFLFIVVSLVFLLLSLISPNIVFQVDSVASFLIAMILLLRDPHTRVMAPVFDAFMVSSDRSIAQLSGISGSSFIYLPGKTVSDVKVVPNPAQAEGTTGKTPTSGIIPPGRALAELYVRESGVKELSMLDLRNTIEPMLTENFGLAGSVRLETTPEKAVVTLIRPSTRCDAGGESTKGMVGCPVSSFLAILLAKASNHAVVLDKCELDYALGQWKISMEFKKV